MPLWSDASYQIDSTCQLHHAWLSHLVLLAVVLYVDQSQRRFPCESCMRTHRCVPCYHSFAPQILPYRLDWPGLGVADLWLWPVDPGRHQCKNCSYPLGTYW